MKTAGKQARLKKPKLSVPGILFIRELEGISEYRLDKNGLQILLAPDPAQPAVGVMVTYHVGSRNEATGYTGATHLLEHLMFKGSKKFNRKSKNGIRDVLETKGAFVNASTYYDRTNYYEVIPRDLLANTLEIEADRMRNANISEKDRRSEMTVVRNEFEQFESSPFIVLDRLVFGLAFQAHPYHNPVIGWRDDIENVSIERLKRFYDDFYWPDNATLSLSGGFDAAEALSGIKKFFGALPRKKGSYPAMYTHEAPQDGQRRGVVKRTGPNMLCMAFKMPAARHKDIAALSLLGMLLTEGKTSRLYKDLVETGYATGVSGSWLHLYDPGLFQIFVTLADVKSHQEVEDLVMQILEDLKKETIPAAEIEKVKISLRARLAHRRDGVYALLDSLNEDIASGDWSRFATMPKEYQKVTGKDVVRVATTYAVQDQSTIGWFVRTE